MNNQFILGKTYYYELMHEDYPALGGNSFKIIYKTSNKVVIANAYDPEKKLEFTLLKQNAPGADWLVPVKGQKHLIWRYMCQEIYGNGKIERPHYDPLEIYEF